MVAAALVLALAGAAPAADRCAVAGSRTVAAGPEVRVYDHRGRIVACARATGRRTRLGYSPAADGCSPDSCLVAVVRVRGPLVAYGADAGGRFGNKTEVVVRDLVHRRLIVRTRNGDFHDEDIATCSANGESLYYGLGPMTDLVLRRDGAVAWIATRDCDYRGRPSYEVHELIPGVSRRMLDAGRLVAPRSLTLAGDVIRWRHGGAPREAPFAP